MKWIWLFFIFTVGLGYWGIFTTGIQPKSIKVIKPSFFKSHKELTDVIKKQLYGRLAMQDIIILGLEDTKTIHLALALAHTFQNITSHKRTVWTNLHLKKTIHPEDITQFIKPIEPPTTEQIWQRLKAKAAQQQIAKPLTKNPRQSTLPNTITTRSLPLQLMAPFPSNPMKIGEKRIYILPIQKSLSFLDKTSWLPDIPYKKRPRILSIAILKVRNEAQFLYGPCTENIFKGPSRLTCLIKRQQKRQQKKPEKYSAPEGKFTISMDQEGSEDFILYLFL